MNYDSILPKRVRRIEVAALALAEEVQEIRQVHRAIYDAILLISRRLPLSALGSTPSDILMLPPWYQNPATGHVLSPPNGLDLDQQGLGALRLKMTLLTSAEIAEVQRSQRRIHELLEKLRKREAERDKHLGKNGGPSF